MDLNQLLLVLHFLGLGLGLAATVVGLVLRGLLAGADPAEARGLIRIGPVMAPVSGLTKMSDTSTANTLGSPE